MSVQPAQATYNKCVEYGNDPNLCIQTIRLDYPGFVPQTPAATPYEWASLLGGAISDVTGAIKPAAPIPTMVADNWSNQTTIIIVTVIALLVLVALFFFLRKK